MALASKHLAVSQPDHAPATTPRATCSATGGLDAQTFRGFQLAGELFLLTSFFIKPNVHASAERVRGSRRKGTTAPLWAGKPGGGQPRERGSFRGYWPFRAHGYCATVNQKAEKFALNKLGSANVPTSRPFSGDARWHQMAPPENFEDSDLSSFQSVTTSIMLNAVRLPLLEANKRRK